MPARKSIPIIFNTLSYSKQLTDVGFTNKQAEVLVQQQVDLIEDKVATRQDLETVSLELKGDIEKTKSELKSDIEKTKSELEAKIELTKAELKADIEKTKSELKSEIEKNRIDIQKNKFDVIKWVLSFIIAQTAILITVFVNFK